MGETTRRRLTGRGSSATKVGNRHTIGQTQGFQKANHHHHRGASWQQSAYLAELQRRDQELTRENEALRRQNGELARELSDAKAKLQAARQAELDLARKLLQLDKLVIGDEDEEAGEEDDRRIIVADAPSSSSRQQPREEDEEDEDEGQSGDDEERRHSRQRLSETNSSFFEQPWDGEETGGEGASGGGYAQDRKGARKSTRSAKDENLSLGGNDEPGLSADNTEPALWSGKDVDDSLGKEALRSKKDRRRSRLFVYPKAEASGAASGRGDTTLSPPVERATSALPPDPGMIPSSADPADAEEAPLPAAIGVSRAGDGDLDDKRISGAENKVPGDDLRWTSFKQEVTRSMRKGFNALGSVNSKPDGKFESDEGKGTKVPPATFSGLASPHRTGRAKMETSVRETSSSPFRSSYPTLHLGKAGGAGFTADGDDPLESGSPRVSVPASESCPSMTLAPQPPDGRPRREVARPLSYREPSLNTKMRKGHVMFPKTKASFVVVDKENEEGTAERSRGHKGKH